MLSVPNCPKIIIYAMHICKRLSDPVTSQCSPVCAFTQKQLAM